MTAASALRPGDVCAFRTSPITSFSHPTTGRHATLKVLTTGEVIVWAVLDCVFPERPDLPQVATAPVLRRQRFAGAGQPAVCSTPRGWDLDLLDFAVLGSIAVTPAELAVIPPHPPVGTWKGASVDAEGEWRWRHDQNSLRREVGLDAQAREARHQAERDRHERRLRHLTWEALLGETPLARWSSAPPFPSSAFTEEVRAMLRDAIPELRALGPKPPKREARRVLRALVERINALDMAHGQVVETEEREDLCEALGELAFVARHPALLEEVHGWRSW